MPSPASNQNAEVTSSSLRIEYLAALFEAKRHPAINENTFTQNSQQRWQGCEWKVRTSNSTIVWEEAWLETGVEAPQPAGVEGRGGGKWVG